MSEQNKKTDAFDPLQDTQYLLRGVDEMASSSFELADILAEFHTDVPQTAEAAPSKSSQKPSQASAQTPPKSSQKPYQPSAQTPPPAPVSPPVPCAEKTRKVSVKPQEKHTVPQDGTVVVKPEKKPAGNAVFGRKPNEKQPADSKRSHQLTHKPLWENGAISQKWHRKIASLRKKSPPPAPPPPPVDRENIEGMGEVVASTVDAVKTEREQAQERMRRRIEKKRRRQKKRRHETKHTPPVPEPVKEPSPKEQVIYHKRRYYSCRVRLIPAVLGLLLLWLPWILTEFGIAVPFFSEGGDNAAVCVLVMQAMLCVIAAPLFRSAVEELKKHRITFHTYIVAANIVTLLDEITLLALPRRTAVAPLGGVAGCALVFALWGMKNYHRGMLDTMHTAMRGRPSSVADCTETGIARGHGTATGFVTRANMEEAATPWQSRILPVLLPTSLFFAVLTSFGRQNGQDILWCWSAILCASCPLCAPLAYGVPLGRIARRLSRSGTAVAGYYGAAALSASPKLVVTDTDIFPHDTVSINGIRLYAEERNRAISYAATLAVQGGGCLGRVFESLCQEEHIAFQAVEHFHVHDENGLGGMIHGETVLVGSPVFMRHRAVRLPAKLPAKTVVCLAVDGELTAIFDVVYTAYPAAELAMRSLSRNGISLVLATRDGNVTPKLLKSLFGTDGKATCPEISECLALSDPQREGGAPNGLLYREGLLPYVELAALSRHLCQIVRVGNFLSVTGCVSGVLLAFYLLLIGGSAVLTPVMLLTYLLLWVTPMLPLLWAVDRV